MVAAAVEAALRVEVAMAASKLEGWLVAHEVVLMVAAAAEALMVEVARVVVPAKVEVVRVDLELEMGGKWRRKRYTLHLRTYNINLHLIHC